MVAVTYGVARVAAQTAARNGKTGKGIFAHVFNAIAESQMRRAEREIARHRHLLPPNFKLTRHEDEPLGGW